MPAYGQKLSDGGGLFIWISKHGKYWRLAYRYDKKQKTLALGIYPQVSLIEARKKREEAKKQLADGVDPLPLAKKSNITPSAYPKQQTLKPQGPPHHCPVAVTGWLTLHHPRQRPRPISRVHRPPVLPFQKKGRSTGGVKPAELHFYFYIKCRLKSSPAFNQLGAGAMPLLTQRASLGSQAAVLPSRLWRAFSQYATEAEVTSQEHSDVTGHAYLLLRSGSAGGAELAGGSSPSANIHQARVAAGFD